MGRLVPMLHLQPSFRCLRRPCAGAAPHSTAWSDAGPTPSATGSTNHVRSKLSRKLIPRSYVRHAPGERPDEPELTPVKGIDDQTVHEHADEARPHHAGQWTRRRSRLADGAAENARDHQRDRRIQKQGAKHPVLREGSNVEAMCTLEHAGSDPEQMTEANVDAAGMSSEAVGVVGLQTRSTPQKLRQSQLGEGARERSHDEDRQTKKPAEPPR